MKVAQYDRKPPGRPDPVEPPGPPPPPGPEAPPPPQHCVAGQGHGCTIESIAVAPPEAIGPLDKLAPELGVVDGELAGLAGQPV